MPNRTRTAGINIRVTPEEKKRYTRLAGRCRHLIVVSGDVFADGERYDGETARYLQALAALNRRAAALADAVCEVVCGIPVPLKGKLP